jgi:hypothetical protein
MVAAVAGCSTSTDSHPEGSPRSTSPPDRALAQAIVLKRTDLTETWQEASASRTQVDDELSKQFGACLNHTTSLFSGQGPNGASAEFADAADSVTVQNTVALASNPAQARGAVQATEQSVATECLRQVITSSIEDDLSASGATADSVGDVAITRRPFSIPGGAAQSFAGVIPVAGGAAPTNVYIDLYYAQHGRAVVTLAYIGVASPIPTGVEGPITSTVMGRLQRVTAGG